MAAANAIKIRDPVFKVGDIVKVKAPKRVKMPAMKVLQIGDGNVLCSLVGPWPESPRWYYRDSLTKVGLKVTRK